MWPWLSPTSNGRAGPGRQDRPSPGAIDEDAGPHRLPGPALVSTISALMLLLVMHHDAGAERVGRGYRPCWAGPRDRRPAIL